MAASPSILHRAASRNIVNKYLKIRPGENVVIESWDHTHPMAAVTVDEVRRAGGRTLHIHEDEAAWWRAIDRKQSKLLGSSSDPEWAALKAADVYLHFWGPGDTDRIERLPDRIGDEAFGWFTPWYDLARKAGLRGGRVALGFATQGRAKRWGLDREQWEERILRACLTDPTETARRGARLLRAISRGRKVRIIHDNGTDLEVALGGGAARLYDGRPHPRDRRYSPYDMLSQIPAGSIMVALDAKTAEGTFHANRRTNIWWHWTAGGTLRFEGGKLVAYSFEEEERAFARRFQQGSDGRDRTGALIFGLNPAAAAVPNLETIERGNVTLALGANRNLPGGTNPSNFMDWVSLAGAEIAIDGTPVVRAGRIL